MDRTDRKSYILPLLMNEQVKVNQLRELPSASRGASQAAPEADVDIVPERSERDAEYS